MSKLFSALKVFSITAIILLAGISLGYAGGQTIIIRDKLPVYDTLEVTVNKAGEKTFDNGMISRGWTPLTCDSSGCSYYSKTVAEKYRTVETKSSSIFAHALAVNGFMNRTAFRMHAANGTMCANSCASESQGAVFIGISTDAGAPAYTSTGCTSEQSGNGIDRALGTVNIGTAASGDIAVIVTKVFSVSGTVTGLQKGCMWTNTAGALLAFENTFSSTNVASGDTLTIKWTINWTN